MEYIPIVVQAVAMPGYKVKVFFHDGVVVTFDMKSKLDKGVFKQIASWDVFSSALTVMNDTIAWDLTGKRDPKFCIDIDPITVYNAAKQTPPLA